MKRKRRLQWFATLAIMLFFTLPLATAVSISGVSAVDVTSHAATVVWETDEPADSFVQYTADSVTLTVGDADAVTSHEVALTNLQPEQDYTFTVQSGDVIDENEYEFMTLAVDIIPPTIEVDVSAVISGTQIDINGTTEAGATVTVLVNSEVASATTADFEGLFSFTGVFLASGLNVMTFSSKDVAGNENSLDVEVFADTDRPQINLTLPEVVEDTQIRVSATFSEPVTYDLVVNNQSQESGEGITLSTTVSLQEGENSGELFATDAAGFTTSESFSILADTQPPRVSATLVKGGEYYEGQAESTISGETEPGAEVYLYTFRQTGTGQQPNFDRAREKVTANADGEFTFADVDFESFNLQLDDLRPREVPTALLDLSVFSSRDLEDAQQKTYYIYLIAEDQTGKTGYWDTSVTVHTCFSQNFDFSPESLAEFQAPLRLNPTLMEQGRQEVQAVFKLNYQGSGVAEDPDDTTTAYQIIDVDFEKACTQTMVDDEDNVGCRLFPTSRPITVVCSDESSVYSSWQLHSAEEFKERDEDLWDDFTSKRQVTFPLKMVVSYQERIGDNEWGETKFQSSCTDLNYFVDIPIESSELIPDFLADEGVDALNWTISQLETVRPILEKATIIAGISCVTSWLGRTVARWVRIFTSKVEGLSGQVPGSDSECQLDQSGMYLESTIEEWREAGLENIPADLISLDEACPSTAGTWKFEAALDKAYKFTCDRAFCREVPARWTETESEEKIGNVILSQQQCAVTGGGIPLVRRENCLELIQQSSPVGVDRAIYSDTDTVCWQDQNGILYRYDQSEGKQDPADTRRNIFVLEPIIPLLGDVALPSEPLRVYQPPGSQDFFVGRNLKCEEVCSNPRRGGFSADTSGGSKGCYQEREIDGRTTLVDGNGNQLTGNKYAAGYTSDCFLGETGLEQCVCIGEDIEDEPHRNDKHTLRSAIEEEPWVYRQAQQYSDSHGAYGTYYSPIRYYDGRDFTGAFGANFLLDYARDDPQVAAVDPHENVISTFQTLCLPGMLKNVVMLESILTGMRNCLVEAKYTGLQDAGMCQALFTRHVCGLMYETVASLVNQCTPVTLEHQSEGEVGVAEVLDSGFDAIGESVESSITDLRDEYGNAVLNEYFSGGAQGFSQSICLAAFGYEMPLFSEEFFLDAAYAFPISTSVVMAPKTRELTTYNPARQTAVFNYNVGGIILPGCRVRNYNVKLKCIGQEDLGYPGVDCGEQQCDCVDAQEYDASFEREKEKIIHSGESLRSGSMHDIPLQTPIQVESNYRYDHVLVEVSLDQSERDNVEHCFDEGVKVDGLTATFYEAINDITPPGAVSCNVDLSGRYQCPELFNLFGMGGAYLEEPYVMCQDAESGAWMDCDTINLYTLGETIRTRVHVQTDGNGQCLVRDAPNIVGVQEKRVLPIPENIDGFYQIQDVLGVVSEGMLGGSYSNIELVSSQSNSGCIHPQAQGSVPEDVSPDEYIFAYENVNGGIQLTVDSGVTLGPDQDYELLSGVVVSAGVPVTDLSELNGIVFDIQGFRISNVVGALISGEDQCVYRVVERGGVTGGVDSNSIRVTYSLYEQDEGGSCRFLSQRVDAGREKDRHRVDISVQREITALLQASEYHDHFVEGRYDVVAGLASPVVNSGQGDLSNALAIYYWTASLVMEGSRVDNAQLHTTEINNLLRAFFTRVWGVESGEPYSDDMTDDGEFVRVQRYLCEVANSFGYTEGVEVCS